MKFREALARDLPTFLCLSELGRYHELERVILVCTVTHYTEELSVRLSEDYRSTA